jgi:hypothetical protein
VHFDRFPILSSGSLDLDPVINIKTGLKLLYKNNSKTDHLAGGWPLHLARSIL